MKRVTRHLWIAVFLVLIFSSCAYAGKGPQDTEHKYPGFIEIRIKGTPDSSQLLFPFGLPTTVAVEGLSYNESTNTLTMRNFKSKEFGLLCGNMGDDFRIKLVGSNELAFLSYISESNYNTNLTIAGKGSLVVNKSRNFDGIYGGSELYGLNMKLIVKKPAKVTAYCGHESGSYSLKFYNTDLPLKSVFKANTKKKVKFKTATDKLPEGQARVYTATSRIVIK